MSNTKTFYESACSLDPTDSGLTWWGYVRVTTLKQYLLAETYAIQLGHRVEIIKVPPEESFMFLLFVALSEGEEF